MRMNGFREPGLWLLGLLLLLLVHCKQTSGSSEPQVDCIVFNEESLTCNWTTKDNLSANYTLHYWIKEGKPSRECPHYFRRDDGLNTGCQLNISVEDFLYSEFHVYINASHGGAVFKDYKSLLERVKPGAPFNLSIQTQDDNQLLLSWESPYRSPQFLQNKVKYKSNKDTSWTEQKTDRMEFSLPSVDPEKVYTFYVSSKVKDAYGKTDLWSDEAGPVHWGKEKEPSIEPWVQVAIGVGSVCLLLLMMASLISMERIRLVLLPAIPNPGKKFEDLFTAYRGNFSEWAGVSKDAVEAFKPNYCESICHISELFPGGGYLPIGSDAMGKTWPIPKGSAP
nr:PREDICTED: cytokine receptor common subunit gamma [Anolis carolinensis]|eukprot:XP_008119977.1 PREDICTED: cytokine receptor common subunit gamma [Anolis carolinensis]